MQFLPRVRLPSALSIGLLLVSATPVPAEAPQDIPTRVGRVSFVSGNAILRTGAEAISVIVNLPIAERQSLSTDAQGRAELRIGGLTVMLSSASQLDIARLDDDVAQFALPRGRIALDLRQLDSGRPVEVDIPRGGIWLLQPGQYDIDAGTPGQPARVTAFAGSARFVGGRIAREITADAALLLSGSDPLVATIATPAGDAFVEWCRTRDVDEAQLAAPFRLSRDMTGYEALDANGSWEIDADHGVVWVPDMLPAQWAPYRYGHWARIAPWGWNWIDDQPWAFAPSHYGRWARIGGAAPESARWAWVPGKFVAHPAYLPAVVGFLGTDGVGLSYADAFGPAITWFPLAPGEVYWPRLTHDVSVIRRLNAGAVADLDAIGAAPDAEAPAEIPGGHFANRAFAISIPRAIFLAGKPVAPAMLDVPQPRLLVAPLLLGSLPQPGTANRPVVAVWRGSARPPQATAAAAAVRAAALANLPRQTARESIRTLASLPVNRWRRTSLTAALHIRPHRIHLAAGRTAFR